MLKNKTALSLSPLALLTLAACGGSNSTVSAVKGKAQKGPLENALVYLDYNRDGEWTSGTDSDQVVSSSTGAYSIAPTSSVYNLVALSTAATIDTSSGTAVGLGVKLEAPAGSTVVTPMTTMVQSLITADELLATPTGVTADTAKEDIALAMGFTAAQISAGFDPLTYDAFSATPDAALDLQVEKTSQKIMSVVKTFAAAGVGAGATAAEAFSAALEGLVEEVSKVQYQAVGAAFTFSTVDMAAAKAAIDVTMASAETAAGITLTAAGTSNDFITASATAATAIVNVAAEIEKVTSKTDANVFAMVETLGAQVKVAAENIVSGVGATTVEFASADGIVSGLNNKAPTDLALTGSTAGTATVNESKSIAEDATSLVIGTLSATDAGDSGTTFSGAGATRAVNTITATHTYSIADGLDGASFSIDASTGGLTLLAQPDYETKTAYNVAVVATDAGGKSYTETFTISVTDTVESGAFGINSDTVTWTDYNPAASADITNKVMTSTTGSTVTMGTGAIRMNLANLVDMFDGSPNNNKSPMVNFTLDSVPVGSGIATIKASILDGADMTKDSGENGISLLVDVAYSNGKITAVAGDATGSYINSAGTTVSFTVSNLDADSFSITAANAVTGMPASLNVKIQSLYEAFVTGAGRADLLAAGTYTIELETTNLPLQNYANETVTKFQGSIELGTATKNSIVGTAGADTITGGTTGEIITAGAGTDTISTGAGSDFVVLATGFGSTTLASSNTVSDFTNGTDKFALDGLTFAELTVAADATTAADTVISIAATSEYLMTVTGVAYGYIDTNDFVLLDAIA